MLVRPARRCQRTVQPGRHEQEVPSVFEPFTLGIDGFAQRLGKNYRAVFGKGEPDHPPALRATTKLALEHLRGAW
jgi:hypothetical protein